MVKKEHDKFDERVSEFADRLAKLCDEFEIWIDRTTLLYDSGKKAEIGPMPEHPAQSMPLYDPELAKVELTQDRLGKS